MKRIILLASLMISLMPSFAIADNINLINLDRMRGRSGFTDHHRSSEKYHFYHANSHRFTQGDLTAASIVYTDRALFQAAFPSFKIETFESSGLIGDISSGATASQTFSYFTVSSTPPAIKVLGASGGEGSFNTTPGGSKYLYLDTDRFSVGSQTTFSLETPTFAFGFDYTGVNAINNIFSATVLSSSYTIANDPNNSTSLFWGIITGLPFSTVILTTSNDSGYGIDQVTLGVTPVPEPSTMLLLGSGIVGLIGFRRKFSK